MLTRHRVDRYREVGLVLARHGFGFVTDGLWPEPRPGAPSPGDRHPTRAEHLRLALEELGPTFIKLGQLLSTRADLLPPAYIAELSLLQADAPPVPADQVARVIREELGQRPEELFLTFDPAPLASASIGQAHAATLRDGTRVVVKVRRPGAVAQVNEDLEILQNLAARAARQWSVAADYNVTGIVAQFDRSLRAELDYLREGHNAERFAQNFPPGGEIRIPRVFWETTTSRVLTLERIDGVRVDDLAGLDRARVDRSRVIGVAVDAIAQMVFVDGFFHADPHPGNLFIQADGSIGLIDFGMVGAIDEQLRDRLAALLVALLKSDPDRVGTALVRLSTVRPALERAKLRADVQRMMSLYEGRELGEVRIAPVVGQLLALVRRHHLQLPADVVLLLRMLLMVEGLGATLDPGFSLGEALRPHVRRLSAEQRSARAVAARAGKAGAEFAALSLEVPERLRRVFDLIDDNGVEVHLRAAELDPLVARIEGLGSRLIAGMITAALISGIGEITTADRWRARSWGGPLLGVGIGGVGALTAYLTWTARRRRRGR
jgi:ubiquinone biosynthesis protein